MSIEPLRLNRAAVLIAPNCVEVCDWPEPIPGHDDVVVEVVTEGVCGSDAHYFKHDHIGNFVVDQPLVLGHEATRTALKISSNVISESILSGAF